MGMQIMIEGLALAAFGFMHMVTQEPLLKQLLRYVLADEARHVAFGVISLQEYYEQLERGGDPRAPGVRVRGRDPHARPDHRCTRSGRRWASTAPTITRMLFEIRRPGMNPFQAALFSKIVPNCKKLGLLDAGDGWLRDRFTEIGVIDFEDAIDTGEEYESFDEVAKDRAATG